MKQWIKELFANDSSASIMRVMSFMCVLTACGIAIHEAKNGRDNVGIISCLLTAGITGKVGQAWIESNESNKK